MTPNTVVVVGAGLAGLTTTIELLKRRLDVVMIFDPNDDHYATRACHGISTIKGIFESDSDGFRWKINGHSGFSDWLKDIETSLGQERTASDWQKGIFERFTDIEGFQKDFGRIYRKDFVGAKCIIYDFQKYASMLEAFYPQDWWINPTYLIDTFFKYLKMHSVQILEERLDMISRTSLDFKLKLSSGAILNCKNVVLCSGADTPVFLKQLNLNKNKWLGVPGYSFNGTTHSIGTAKFVKGMNGLICGNDRIYVGSSSSSAKEIQSIDDIKKMLIERQKDSPSAIALEIISKMLSKTESQLITSINSCWGIRVRLPDRLPLVKHVVFPDSPGNLWINSGYYKSGIILSWLFATKLAIDIEGKFRV
jgi:glycine/D-amino acid oxidase-like deaminating enzyme